MKHALKLSIFVLLISAAVILWNMFIPAPYQNTHIYFILPVFIVFSFITHFLYNKSLRSSNNNAFTAQFMALTGLKLFACLIIIVIYGFVNKPQLTSFAVLFLFIYLAFTIYETITLFRTIKKLKETNTTNE